VEIFGSVDRPWPHLPERFGVDAWKKQDDPGDPLEDTAIVAEKIWILTWSNSGIVPCAIFHDWNDAKHFSNIWLRISFCLQTPLPYSISSWNVDWGSKCRQMRAQVKTNYLYPQSKAGTLSLCKWFKFTDDLIKLSRCCSRQPRDACDVRTWPSPLQLHARCRTRNHSEDLFDSHVHW
jgi:hypothetical protein